MTGSKDLLQALRVLILSAAVPLSVPNCGLAQSDFTQGVCGQTIRSSVTLTQDLLGCSGDGIIIGADGLTLEADGRRIEGTGSRRHIGIGCQSCRGVVIQHAFVSGFETGVGIHGGSDNHIQENYLHDNGTAVVLESTSLNVVTRNIIRSNTLGIASSAPVNAIYRNILWANSKQIEDGGGNSWADPVAGRGNYWSNYWGRDDGSGGRIAGDFVGDTRLPHEGVDYAPLLDPSVEPRLGGLLCDDFWETSFWLVWRGGWSPVDIKITDPLRRIISRNANQLGEDGFYAEDSQVVPGSTLAQAMVGVCTKYYSGEGIYSFEATASAPLAYWMEWYPALDGRVPFRRSVQNVVMATGETHRADLRLKAVDGSLAACAVVPIDIKPATTENTINLGSEGVVPVGILSQPNFDATTVNPASIRLASAGVRWGGQPGGYLCEKKDLNGDARLDLECKIETSALKLPLGESVAELIARTVDSAPVCATDKVRLLP